jgi:hypothetical protein
VATARLFSGLASRADPLTRFGILCACLGCLALCAASLQLNAPWLAAENRRLEPWKVPIVWLSEATGLAAFVAYMVRLTFTSAKRPWRPRKYSVRVIVLSTCLDAGMSLWSMAEEYLGHSRAVRVQAQVVDGTTRVMPAGDTRLTFTCTFQDQQGVVHSAWFPLVKQPDVPINVQQAVLGGQLPATAEVLYDPRWPGRTWLADLEYTDDGRLFFYSLISLFCSTLLAIVLRGLNEDYRFVPPPASAAVFIMTVLFSCVAYFQGW